MCWYHCDKWAKPTYICVIITIITEESGFHTVICGQPPIISANITVITGQPPDITVLLLIILQLLLGEAQLLTVIFLEILFYRL